MQLTTTEQPTKKEKQAGPHTSYGRSLTIIQMTTTPSSQTAANIQCTMKEEVTVPHTCCSGSPLCENPPNVNTDNAPHENTKTHNHQRPMTDPTTGKAQYHTPAMAAVLSMPKTPQQEHTRELQTKHEPMWTPTLWYKMEVPHTHLGRFSPSMKPPSEEYTNKAQAKLPHLLKWVCGNEVHSLCDIQPDQCTDQIQERQECTATHTLTLDFPQHMPPLCNTPPNNMIQEPSPQHLQHTQQWTPHTHSGRCVVISGKMAPKEQSPLPQMKPNPTRTWTEPQHGIWTCAVAKDLTQLSPIPGMQYMHAIIVIR
ncbi:hypothetical protein BS47DRAFT_1368469 [Hydnum rufescens UP504]|uniref:Uncharacterized protein n=1 Tax=Hydnum rufescens UP504 TaxID=1448309 RepID=A0A9P6AGM0_9AGAM|nr:hypothetical protein BS47DRAFT_1368469 [Hydnum rufescens UP504]